MSSKDRPGGPPYLSVVVTARNDDHGGRLLHRLQLFVDGLAAQCDRHGMDAELLLVEWNPPHDESRLGDALVWPSSRRCSFRLIEVPPHVHAQLEHSDRLPLFQMIAKNVGIRRARGDWVLATNVDVLFSDALMQRLARRNLDPAVVYRVDRYDVEDVFEVGKPIGDQLRTAAENVIRVCRRDATVDLRTGEVHRLHRRNARLVFEYLPNLLVAAVLLVRAVLRMVVYATRWGIAWIAGRRRRAQVVGWLRGRRDSNDKAAHSSKPKTPAAGWREIRKAIPGRRPEVHLHTNACGDFTLLTREAWHRLRGYPELQIFSMHLDSLLLFQAHAAGYRERILPQPLYHIEHSSGFTPETWRDLAARISAASIRQLTWDEVVELASEMSDRGGPLDFNNDHWGFADDELPEHRPATANAA